MEIVRWQPTLEEILTLDLDTSTAALSIRSIVEFWPLLDRADTLAGVCKAALVYSLARTRVLTDAGDIVPKWRLVQIDEAWPLVNTWADFCLMHLGMTAGKANAYGSLWEVYHVDLGKSFEDMAAAGMFRLKAACGTIRGQLDRGIHDKELLGIIFGKPDVCSTCFYERHEELTECPGCGQDWQGLGPAPRGELLIKIAQLNKPTGPIRLDAGIDTLSHQGYVYVTPTLEMDGKTSYLPPWEVKIIKDDAEPDDLGIRESHKDEFLRRLRRLGQ